MTEQKNEDKKLTRENKKIQLRPGLYKIIKDFDRNEIGNDCSKNFWSPRYYSHFDQCLEATICLEHMIKQIEDKKKIK